MTTEPRHPHLLKMTDPPTTVGHRCVTCERVAFPPDPYGCEKCGSPASTFEQWDLEARGSVQAVATVHRHHRSTPVTPFTVGVIGLVGGPVVKAIVEGDSVVVGSTVEGFLTPGEQDDDGNVIVDLHFRVVQ